jgi:hypothetical protein
MYGCQFDNVTSMYAEASLDDEHRLKTFEWYSDFTYTRSRLFSHLVPAVEQLYQEEVHLVQRTHALAGCVSAK